MLPSGHLGVAYVLHRFAGCDLRVLTIAVLFPDLVDKPLKLLLHVVPDGRTFAHGPPSAHPGFGTFPAVREVPLRLFVVCRPSVPLVGRCAVLERSPVALPLSYSSPGQPSRKRAGFVARSRDVARVSRRLGGNRCCRLRVSVGATWRTQVRGIVADRGCHILQYPYICSA